MGHVAVWPLTPYHWAAPSPIVPLLLVLTQVGDGVEQRHISATYHRITDSGVKGHYTDKHAVQKDLQRKHRWHIDSTESDT